MTPSPSFLTDPEAAFASEPAPPAPRSWRPRTGTCPCCGASSGKLFAMGHDARFRGQLQRALAADGDWNATVSWFSAGGVEFAVRVSDALSHIRVLVGRNWTERVAVGAARLRRGKIAPPPFDPPSPDEPARVDTGAAGDPSPEQAVAQSLADAGFVDTDRRIDALMSALNRPLTGQWGWLVAKKGVGRTPARVQATRHRDNDPTIDLWCPEVNGGTVLTEVSAERWTLDWDAKV